MLTEYEARTLSRAKSENLEDSGHYVVAVIIAGAVGLLFVIALAGANLQEAKAGANGGSDARRAAAAQAKSPPLVRFDSSAAPYRPQLEAEPESKRVFDERRRRYIEAYPESQVARDMGAQRDAHSDGGYAAYSAE